MSTNPTREEIEREAYFLFIARDCQHGADLDDWLQAERQLATDTPSIQPKLRAVTRRTSKPRSR